MSVNNIVPNFQNGVSFTAVGAVASPIPKYTNPVSNIAANTTLKASDSGSIYTISQAGAYVVTLPAVQNGLYYKFIAATLGANNFTINSLVTNPATTPFEGVFISGTNGAIATTNVTAKNSVRFTASKAKIGDYIELVCDGTTWYVSGMSSSVSANGGLSTN